MGAISRFLSKIKPKRRGSLGVFHAHALMDKGITPGKRTRKKLPPKPVPKVRKPTLHSVITTHPQPNTHQRSVTASGPTHYPKAKKSRNPYPTGKVSVKNIPAQHRSITATNKHIKGISVDATAGAKMRLRKRAHLLKTFSHIA